MAGVDHRTQLTKCQCGHPRIDHRHGGTNAVHCLHRTGCWDYDEQGREFNHCDPCGCDEFTEVA